jgi:hypothetical protein
MKVLVSSVMLFFIFLFFQNCSPQMKFQAQESKSESVASVAAPTAQATPRVRAPASPPAPPLTLLQKAQAMCPNTIKDGSVNWSKVDWNLPANNSSSAPPCIIKDINSNYTVEKCSSAGFSDIGSGFNFGYDFIFHNADYVPTISFPSQGGDFIANILKIDSAFVRTAGTMMLNSLEIGSVAFEANGISCIALNSANKISAKAYSSNAGVKLALFGVKVNNLKGHIKYLNLASLGTDTDKVYIVDADVTTIKIDNNIAEISLKNVVIENLCTSNNAVIVAAEESGVKNYISDLTDIRCQEK